MDKEKIKTMFTGKRKIENLVVLLILSIIIVIAINYIWKDEKKNTNEQLQEKQKGEVVQVSSKAEESSLEEKLEKILSKISGVGEVKVLITYSESSTLIPIYDENKKTSNTTENDDSGGTRTIEETDNQRQVIYKENNDGSKEPVTQSIIQPKIEGAIVVATGADNATVKAKIIQAIEATTGIATHKIQVFEMGG